MKCRGEEGTALPAVLALLAILLIMGLEAAASALSVRLGIARGATAQQARAAAEAGLLLAGELPSGRLENLLESQTPVKLKSSYWPVGLDVSLEVHDDEEIDQRDGIHGNGRVFFLTRASQPFSPGSGMVVRSFVEEALVGAWTPQPGAVLDCVSGLAFCDGLGECRPPASHLSFQKGAALAVPEDRWIALKARWRIHLREMLRRASEACGEAGGTCRPALRDLWLAAATDMLRQFDDPTGNALALSRLDVNRLVAGLLEWTPTTRGAVSLPWIGGTLRRVAHGAQLGEVLEGLGRPGGHLPPLARHPSASILRGARQMGLDGGICARFPALLSRSLKRARALPDTARGPDVGWIPAVGPAPAEAYLLEHPLRVLPGQAVRGRGLLILKTRLEIPEGAALRWLGEVILAGGSMEGRGEVEIEGGLLLLNPPDAGGKAAIQMNRMGLTVRGDPRARARALSTAGTVLLSSWEETAFP